MNKVLKNFAKDNGLLDIEILPYKDIMFLKIIFASGELIIYEFDPKIQKFIWTIDNVTSERTDMYLAQFVLKNKDRIIRLINNVYEETKNKR